MKKLAILLALACVFWSSVAWATAHAVKTPGANSYGIVVSGDVNHTFPTGNVMWILWKPSAAADVLCIRDVSAAGAALIYATSVDGSSQVLYIGGKCTPFLVFASCTIGTGANYEVTAFYKK